jgi:alkylglycerol monooxygenase
VDATAYYAIGIPLYIVLFGVESAIGRARRQPAPSFAGSVSNIGTGLGAIVVGMIVGPLMVGLYDWVHRSFGLVEWSAWWPAFFVALVLGDLGNYWRHRLEHRWSVLWAVHNVHHTPQEMNLSVGMRHAWLSDTYAFPFYALLPLVVPTAQFFLAMVAITLYALFTHSRAYDFPSFGLLVTPKTHAIHHARNPRYPTRTSPRCS